jgi:hypothetical protein
MPDPAAKLAEFLHHEVAPHGFRRFDPPSADPPLPWIAAWKRKTWNTNRGIALLRLPAQSAHAGEYARDVRVPAGKAIGYLPFLYELGLQLVLLAPGGLGKAEGLERYVTPVNNSTVLLQSIHLVDPETRAARSVRTWGQVVTGPFIDAIETGISAFLG